MMFRSLSRNACTLLAMGGFLFAGCQKDTPAGPMETGQGGAITFLELPGGSLQKMTTVSDTITVESGGVLQIHDRDGAKKTGDGVKLDLEVSFRPHSVTNDFVATMSADAYYAMSSLDLSFGPQNAAFLEPATVKMHVSGMDLSGMPEGARLHLFYVDNNSWVIMPGTVTYNRHTGEVKCQDGKLPHFSRYAFGY